MKRVRLQQKSKQWLDWRRNKVMASDSPIIMGESKFKTIEKLYDEKVKGYEVTPNQYMMRGNELEPAALQNFEKETGLIMFPCVGIHDDLDWMAASFDGITLEGDALVEVKCPGRRDHNEAMQGMIPKHYRAQIQHQIHVAGIEFAYYFSFDGESGVIVEVKRDQEFIEKMIEKEKEFWHSLQAHNATTTRSNEYATVGAIS